MKFLQPMIPVGFASTLILLVNMETIIGTMIGLALLVIVTIATIKD